MGTAVSSSSVLPLSALLSEEKMVVGLLIGTVTAESHHVLRISGGLAFPVADACMLVTFAVTRRCSVWPTISISRVSILVPMPMYVLLAGTLSSVRIE